MPPQTQSLARLCLTLFLSTFLYNTAFSQINLLLNGNFEDINTCTEFKAECGVEAWFYLKDVTIQMTPGEPGTDQANDNAFAIFYKWNGYTGFTPIIGTILPCTLQKGKQYIFKGMIAAKLSPKLILKPGICTGENFYVPKRPFAKEMKPDSIMQLKQSPKQNFFEFEYRFISSGDERYLTFGTFVAPDPVTGKKGAYGTESISIMLDNFSLAPVDSAETFCEAYKRNKEKIYDYNYRHKDMDYTLWGKGRLPVALDEREKANLTQIEEPPPPPVIPDTLKLGDVLFDFNKAVLKPAANEMLDIFFKNNNDKREIDSIFIEGHTDSIGTDARNMQLSRQRCEAVQQWMIVNKILFAGSIQIHPFGRSRPIASNKTPQGRALNRRVEVVVFRKRAG